MNCRTVTNRKGEDFQLTENEEKFIRALERLSKIRNGRIRLMANGSLLVRINDNWKDDSIDYGININISCEGGDGGDDASF